MNNFLTHYDRYEANSQTYTHGRSAGLFSMLNWVLRQLCLLEMEGKEVKHIQLYLDEYFNRLDTFNQFFTIKDIKLSLKDLPYTTKKDFHDKVGWSYIGFGANPREIDLSITNQVIQKYFNPTKEVMDWYNVFVDYLGGNIDDVVFVWARGTDKQTETTLPSIDTYSNVISSLDTQNKKVVIQTDDETLIDGFKYRNLNFTTLPQIPFPKIHNQPFHINLRSVPDSQFEESYGISKIDYLRQMIALSIISVKSHKTILYPGNPTSFILSMKGSFDDLILFKNREEIF